MDDAEISAPADMSAATRGMTVASAWRRRRIMAGVRGMGLALRGVTSGRLEEEQMNTIPANMRPTGNARTLTRVSRQTQLYGVVAPYAIGLSDSACALSVRNLNQVLADTMTLRDLYKKHHWQVAGPTFYSLHLLFDKHFEEQVGLVDSIAERIQALGGVTLAMAHDVAETTLIPRPPKGREAAPAQISRLLHAHQIVLKEARTMARLAADRGDHGTNDLLVSSIIRTNEAQVWFVAEHVVDVPLVQAK
jgi:starvation-inducible DNA-binding protein